MLITAVDTGLERLLRTELPLPENVGDVSFDHPDKSWGARLSRVTVNLFLFDVERSTLPPYGPAERVGEDGRLERRVPLPLLNLRYLVTAWAGNVRDEHNLLGDLVYCLLRNPVMPPELFPEPPEGTVKLQLAARQGRKPGDLWGVLEGRARPTLEIEVLLASDAFPWVPTAPEVTQISTSVPPLTEENAPPPRYAPRPVVPTTRRRVGSAVVSEGRPGAGVSEGRPGPGVSEGRPTGRVSEGHAPSERG